MRTFFVTVVAVFVAFLVSPLLRADAGCIPAPAPSDPASALQRWSDEQIANARIIVATGDRRRVPEQGLVIAVATALQESSLRNLRGGDRDSIGLFQQRPSQGWGTPEQLADPAYQTQKFYDKLLTVQGWQDMRLTEAAQAVQISGYPEAYAKHTRAATALVDALSGTAACERAV
ncbi:peptidase M23 [Actinoplanes sp. NEAU-A12]|uniref:Peptidase M23 n=1 Tax=Actinoplanes sandaracinus TaxID=3045177 RepID=A0ABT6WIL9_9ACTN|nr:peptidase M23 [Actinoplanes sandaracinus]